MTDRFVVVPAAYVYLLRETDRGPEVLLQLRSGTPYTVSYTHLTLPTNREV